jgi:hypothetical protein
MSDGSKVFKILHVDPGGNTFRRVNVVGPGSDLYDQFPSGVTGGVAGTNETVIGITGGTSGTYKTIHIPSGW